MDLEEVIRICDKLGVKIIEENGNYRTMFNILEELSKKYEEINQNENMGN